MSLIDKWLGKKNYSKERIQILELKEFLDELLLGNHYIAKSEYLNQIKEYQEVIDYFDVLSKSNMLKSFCKKQALSLREVNKTIKRYQSIETLVDAQNDKYIKSTMVEEKEYLDNVLKDVDANILLDDDQRRVILTDEDYMLVIAGAGAGKTTTVAAKVKYLVDKQGIDPSQILVISFTNKAVQELKERIQRDLNIPCPIATFHSTGNAILRKKTNEKLNIVDDSKLYYVIQDYLKNSILKNEALVKNLILFFASYFDAPIDNQEDLEAFFNKLAKSNFSTMKSDLEEYKTEIIDSRTKKNVTIQNEILRSAQEVEIANFLYLNQIDYEYEPIYPYHIEYSRKPYTPDFILRQNDQEVYLEHFGISQKGENNRYTQNQLNKYKKSINDKILLHRKHNTKLIYTFSEYNDSRTLREHLKEELEKAGFILRPKDNKEVMEKIISTEENRYIRRLINLICRFINGFKTNNYQLEDFNRMYHSTTNVRSKLFLSICQECYLEYDRYLKENNAVDFQDMINDSARLLKECKDMNRILDFKYIIVDEYQDISRQRFDLTTALSEVTNAKIIAVGDDWQSIYAFSGSDITLFTKFEEKMGYAKLLKIVKTYRNAQQVIDIAGNFIQKNKNQIQKELKSTKSIKNPVIIYTYDNSRKKEKDSYKKGSNYALAQAVETALKQILIYNQKENTPNKNKVLLLGRYGFDGDRLERTGLFEYIRQGNKIRSVKYPQLDIQFMTAHASKGLGYDNVIVINAKNE
ncbi:MAG: UvrD-helicase domain-containing protein, partial [Traorella sp.]